MILIVLLVSGCPRPPDNVSTPTPVTTRADGDGVVEGHLRRSDAGDIYFDHRYRFRVQGPVSWTPRLNFAEASTRVEFREPGNDQPCRLQIRMGGALAPDAIRTELKKRGDLFYLNETKWSVSDERPRDDWEPETMLVASVDLPGGTHGQLSVIIPWRGERMEIVGDFPNDRISSCKPALDTLVGSLRPFEGTAELTSP